MNTARLRERIEAWERRALAAIDARRCLDPATELAAAKQALAELPPIPTMPDAMCPGCDDD